MPTRPTSSKRKKEQAVRVNVVQGSAPKLSTPPVQLPELKIETPQPIVKVPPAESKRIPRPEMSEAHRWRVLRWSVGIAMVVILGGWLVTVRYEVAGANRGNILTDLFHSIRSLKFGSSAQPSQKEKEVRQYQQQVFPQFTNQTNQ